MKKYIALLSMVIMAVLLAGCSKGGLNDLNKAKGVITLDGQPLANASITLIPTTPNARSAGAISDEKGRFEFQTLNSNDGVAAGEYQVTVTKFIMENAYTDEEARIFSEAGGKSHKQVFPDRPEPKSVNQIPARYANQATSGLTLTIGDSNSDLKLELTSN